MALRGLDEWEVSKPEVFPKPKPVVYSRVVCRCCEGRTVEVEPGVQRIGTDERHGRFGQPWMRVTSYRFWCDGCGVVTWRKNR